MRAASAGGRQGQARGQTRTVVKGKYRQINVSKTTKGGKSFTTRNQGAVQAMKDHLDYAAHRPNEEGKREFRTAFTAERTYDSAGGNAQGAKHELHKMIDTAQEKYAYQFILSAGRDMNEVHTTAWGRAMLESAGFNKYIAVAHAGETGHTKHPHLHAIVFTDEKLTREDFTRMRLIGDFEYESGLRMIPGLERLEPEHIDDPGKEKGGGRTAEVQESGRSQKKQVEREGFEFE